MPKRNWQDADREILAALNFVEEYEALGAKALGPPRPDGYTPCFARDRDERNASASFNAKSGRYKDHGGHGESLSFFEFAAKYGGHGDWKAARKHYAEKVGVKLPDEKEKARPLDQLEPRPWRPSKLIAWLKLKEPITLEAIQANGGQFFHCYGKSLLGLPVFPAGTGVDSAPKAWVCWNTTGEKLPVKGGEVKVKNYGPVSGGLLGFWALERLEHGGAGAPELVWKVEGPSDMLALWGAIPPELRERHLVICNGGGSEERPTAEVIQVFGGVPVHVLHDADKAGESGGQKWAAALARVTQTRHVRLPYDVADKGGKDLRDWLKEGGTYAQLLEMAAATAPTEAAAGGLGEGEGAGSSGSVSAATFGPLLNVKPVAGDDDKAEGLTMDELLSNVKERTGDWPRKSGGKLFWHDGGSFRWLSGSTAFFGWLAKRVGRIDWKRSTDCVSKEEFFQEFLGNATEYDSVEFMPHEPQIPGVYYACDFPKAGDGTAVTKLLDLFSVGSNVDRQLILAMFATTVWGGLPGSRPMFMITSDDGRGVGKSKITDILAAFCGGAVELSANGDIDVLRSRLLSPKAAKKRLARLDNVKSFRFSCADIESLITASTISGKEMWVGEGDRQNNLTWLLTLNGASLSEDMAQRVVTIKITRPTRKRDWEKDVLAFIASHRQEIIGDLLDFLRGPAAEIPLRSRWASWEGEIVGRLQDWEAVQDAIADRSGEANVEARDIEEFEELACRKLEELGYHPDHERIFIPTTIIRQWWSESMGERVGAKAGRIVSQYVTEGKTQNLKIHRLNRDRGFAWEGAAVDEFTPMKTDLDKKIRTGGF